MIDLCSKHDSHNCCKSTPKQSNEHAEIIDKASWSARFPVFANCGRVAAVEGAGSLEALRRACAEEICSSMVLLAVVEQDIRSAKLFAVAMNMLVPMDGSAWGRINLPDVRVTRWVEDRCSAL
jgi:hypothetical protein